MPFSDLKDLIEYYQAEGEVHEVDRVLSPRFEVASFVWHLSERFRKITFFPKIKGHETPVVANVVFARKVISRAMGLEEDQLQAVFGARLKQPKKPLLLERGGVKEESVSSNLADSLPILIHYEGDSSAFITTGLVSAVDPDTGFVGRGIHRMELRGPKELGMALLNPPLTEIYERCKKQGRPMPVAVVIGVEPITFLSFALRVPPGVDKLELAGGLRGEPVEVTPGELTGIEVPARAQFLLEGTLDPRDERKDGPLGEICGYYLAVPSTPTFKVECISSCKSPIYHALLPRSREADLMLTLVAEAIFSPRIGELFPFVKGFAFMPHTFGSSLVLKVEQSSREEVRALIVYLLSLGMIKKVVVVDEEVDIQNYWEVEWAVMTRCQPDKDIIIIDGLKGQAIDPSSVRPPLTSKIGIDATGYERVKGWERVSFPEEAEDKAESYLQSLF